MEEKNKKISPKAIGKRESNITTGTYAIGYTL
jgi:hypothetical protein